MATVMLLLSRTRNLPTGAKQFEGIIATSSGTTCRRLVDQRFPRKDFKCYKTLSLCGTYNPFFGTKSSLFYARFGRHMVTAKFQTIMNCIRGPTIRSARTQALQSIGFLENYISQTDQWHRRLQELTEFYDTFGHSNVPEDYAENYQLGQWVMNQRLLYKYYLAGLQSPLSPERIEALEAIGFQWNVHSHHWFQMFRRLREHAETRGNLRVEQDDLRLWLIQQRHAHRRKMQNRPSSMTDQRQAALESIPHFRWSKSKDSGPSVNDWEELFAGIREKGIAPGMRPKQHWFEGESRYKDDVSEIYTDDDLFELWNMENDEGDDEDDDDI